MKKLLIILSFAFASANTYSQIAATITMWKDSAMSPLWNKATNTVAYGKPDANGIYKIFLSDSLGNNERQLTYPGWRSDRVQYAEEWLPSGDYLICYVEKDAYVFESDHNRVPGDAIPGYGGYTDIWLLKRDGTQAWQLTNLPNNYDSGVIHGAISEDGTMFAWSQRVKRPDAWNPALGFGEYVFKVADLTIGASPSLSNIRKFQPGGVAFSGELESISNDKTTLAFYSSYESKNIWTTPIYTINMITNVITQLTPEMYSQCPTYTPNNARMVYVTAQDCDKFPGEWFLGADWWVLDPATGGNKQRLTYMNVTNHPQSVNKYRGAGSLTFMSNTSFLGGIMKMPIGLMGYTVKVDFNNVMTGIEAENNNKAVELSIYPSPANETVHFNISENNKNARIMVVDILGKEVLNIDMSKQNFVSEQINLPNGVYIANLFIDGSLIQAKRFQVVK
ncbi:MAG: T9SS type A sorting domain-containing protein [Bacteroidota bacterium]